MKKKYTKIWNNIMDCGIGIPYVEECSCFNIEDISIYRLITQEENYEYKLFKNLYIGYNKQGNTSVNTHPLAIDLVSGKIKHIANYKSILSEKICKKMYKEYSKEYFNKFRNKVELRKKYKKSVELWNWYNNKYDGRYDFMKIKEIKKIDLNNSSSEIWKVIL